MNELNTTSIMDFKPSRKNSKQRNLHPQPGPEKKNSKKTHIRTASNISNCARLHQQLGQSYYCSDPHMQRYEP